MTRVPASAAARLQKTMAPRTLTPLETFAAVLDGRPLCSCDFEEILIQPLLQAHRAQRPGPFDQAHTGASLGPLMLWIWPRQPRHEAPPCSAGTRRAYAAEQAAVEAKVVDARAVVHAFLYPLRPRGAAGRHPLQGKKRATRLEETKTGLKLRSNMQEKDSQVRSQPSKENVTQRYLPAKPSRPREDRRRTHDGPPRWRRASGVMPFVGPCMDPCLRSCYGFADNPPAFVVTRCSRAGRASATRRAAHR